MSETTETVINVEPEIKVVEKRVHRTGPVIPELPVDAVKVNALKDLPLDAEYFIVGDKIYKKAAKGGYRELVTQIRKTGLRHFFFRDRDTKRKLTLNAKKMSLLSFKPAPGAESQTPD
jgi:hypothetical protein